MDFVQWLSSQSLFLTMEPLWRHPILTGAALCAVQVLLALWKRKWLSWIPYLLPVFLCISGTLYQDSLYAATGQLLPKGICLPTCWLLVLPMLRLAEDKVAPYIRGRWESREGRQGL